MAWCAWLWAGQHSCWCRVSPGDQPTSVSLPIWRGHILKCAQSSGLVWSHGQRVCSPGTWMCLRASHRETVVRSGTRSLRSPEELAVAPSGRGGPSVSPAALGCALEQEEEVEHGTLRIALAQAPVEPNARRWALRSDDEHQRPAAESLEEPDELLQDPHVAQQECQRPMRRCVKCLGHVEGQDVILLLLTLQPALGQEHRGTRRGAWHGPELPVRSQPLARQDGREPPHEGVMSIRISCCPSAMGLYLSRLPVAVPLGISQIMASCQDAGTSAPRRMALCACTRSPCTGSGSSAMRAAVTRLDPGALSSATACFTASLRSFRV